ncbi:MAG: class I tRNA ligase family protein, partial [bacterium]|nr:class I tRNA ligase family protein [bacterium]
MFKPVSPKVDFSKLEREILEKWYKKGIVKKYLAKNNSSKKKFSFLDGPITANNPMGVHHAWGRTYKDLWQRFWNMRGYKQRFQNGFDEQGLWVEVEVEKELGLKNKKDIENLVPNDRFKSLEKFINLCKERVKKYSSIQTEQSKRLGYFMDWENSYHTSSDENNYAIWNFIKVVYDKGWLYKGRDSVPWCPRCGTAISQHEILTEEYKEITHDSIFIEYPIIGRKNEFLIAWTTTPWTLIANVALTIHPDYDYVIATGVEKGNKYYLLKESAEKLKLNIEKVIKGQDLVGLNYVSPFDDLARVKKSLAGYEHEVIATDELILPISKEEGTGIVHTATGAGSEDFQLGKKYKLPVIEVIDEEANYLDGLGDFSKKNGKNQPELIIDFLKKFEDGKYLFLTKKYTHRYPTCWRCKTELVWRVVDEWYIAMDRPSRKASDGKQTYREMMVEVAKKINWIPEWGLERELDWLKNMHDWLISKKRYWGLALPIWECQKCGKFTVVGGHNELEEKAIEGWEKFDGQSPHRPWIDQVKVKCENCNEIALRIPDVGNPWLDAGIVPFSTLNEDWFPADFITESFPGQFKNWFYSLIAMSTALKNTNSFKTILGFASVRDEKGE